MNIARRGVLGCALLALVCQIVPARIAAADGDGFPTLNVPSNLGTPSPQNSPVYQPTYGSTNSPAFASLQTVAQPGYGPAFAPTAYVPVQPAPYPPPAIGTAPVAYSQPAPEIIASPVAVPGTYPSNYSPMTLKSDSASISSVQPACKTCGCDRLIESSWYTRIDYFHWNERLGGADFETENGPFFTLGYQHRYGDERIRLEVFDSTVDSSSDIVNNLGNVEALHSKTNYFGVRGEYDLLFNPETLPSLTFFTGIGTRFWIRDLPDDFTVSGTFVQGYQETWWTFYPYIGFETRRNLENGVELYGMGRVGFTAITLERATVNDLALYPRLGFTAQLEAGFRGKNLYCAAYSEFMSWQQSAVVSGWLQPTSTMLTVGVRAGSTF